MNRPEAIPAPDGVMQYMFDQGYLVGEFANQMFQGGIGIGREGFMEGIWATRRLIAERWPLLEAGMLHGRTYCRVDILDPTNEDEWDMVEMKSSISVKDVHIDDVAFQRYCCEKAGLKIGSWKLGLVNSQYVKDGGIEARELFVLEDTSDRVEEAIRLLLDRLKHPLYYLDFETVEPPIPAYDGMRPYGTVPFQFSLHIVETPGSEAI